MKCPGCNSDNLHVYNSRPNDVANAVYRRRSCGDCGVRFTTWEVVAPEEASVLTPHGAILPFGHEGLVATILSALAASVPSALKQSLAVYSSPVTK
jgi:transcriptional repressor NrdR